MSNTNQHKLKITSESWFLSFLDYAFYPLQYLKATSTFKDQTNGQTTPYWLAMNYRSQIGHLMANISPWQGLSSKVWYSHQPHPRILFDSPHCKYPHNYCCNPLGSTSANSSTPWHNNTPRHLDTQIHRQPSERVQSIIQELRLIVSNFYYKCPTYLFLMLATYKKFQKGSPLVHLEPWLTKHVFLLIDLHPNCMTFLRHL